VSFFSKLFKSKSRSELIAEYETSYEVQNRSDEDYKALGQRIWKNYVPTSGQSEYVQGELLRAIEKLRDEALRNGNVNWDVGHEILALYIRDTLTSELSVPEDSKKILEKDIARILKYQIPYLKDDLFDRITNIILDWCFLHENPIKREINQKLYR